MNKKVFLVVMLHGAYLFCSERLGADSDRAVLGTVVQNPTEVVQATPITYRYKQAANGTQMCTYSTGLKAIRKQDGSKKFIYPDGMIFKEYSDGSSKYMYPDGSIKQIDSNGEIKEIVPSLARAWFYKCKRLLQKKE